VGFDLRCFALVLVGLVVLMLVCTWTPICSLSCLFDIVLTVSMWMLMYHTHVCCVICALHKPKLGYCFYVSYVLLMSGDDVASSLSYIRLFACVHLIILCGISNAKMYTC
jgi:hypothetical protein